MALFSLLNTESSQLHRDESASAERADRAWRLRLRARALSRWRFYAQQARQLRGSGVAAAALSSDSDEGEAWPAARPALASAPGRACVSRPVGGGAPASASGRPGGSQPASPGSPAGRSPVSHVPCGVQQSFLQLQRAHSLRRRQLLQRALAAWRRALAQGELERTQLRRATRRHRWSLLLRSLHAWRLACADAGVVPGGGGIGGADAPGPVAQQASNTAAVGGVPRAGVGQVPASPESAPVAAMAAGVGAAATAAAAGKGAAAFSPAMPAACAQAAPPALSRLGEVLPRLIVRRLRWQAFVAW